MVIINIDMTPLKSAVFNEIRKAHEEMAGLTDEQLHSELFHTQDSLRLSLAGFIIIRKIFTAYSFELPETIKSRHRMGMAKMEYPYFFTKTRLILFSEMDAMVVKLSGGIEGFLENCYQFDK